MGFIQVQIRTSDWWLLLHVSRPSVIEILGLFPTTYAAKLSRFLSSSCRLGASSVNHSYSKTAAPEVFLRHGSLYHRNQGDTGFRETSMRSSFPATRAPGTVSVNQRARWFRKQYLQSVRRPKIPENFRRTQVSHAQKSPLAGFPAPTYCCAFSCCLRWRIMSWARCSSFSTLIIRFSL